MNPSLKSKMLDDVVGVDVCIFRKEFSYKSSGYTTKASSIISLIKTSPTILVPI